MDVDVVSLSLVAVSFVGNGRAGTTAAATLITSAAAEGPLSGCPASTARAMAAEGAAALAGSVSLVLTAEGVAATASAAAEVEAAGAGPDSGCTGVSGTLYSKVEFRQTQ